MQTCNAFFRKCGTIKTLADFGSSEQIADFFDAGYEDVDKLIEVCEQYEHKCPCQIKMIYDVKTEHFDAHYEYEDPTTDKDFGVDKLFLEWIEQEKQKRKEEQE